MLRQAVGYPTSGDDGIGATLLAGGLLLLAMLFVLVSPFLLLAPLFVAIGFLLIVRGYYVRVLRWTTRYPDADAPPFDDWGGLAVDGLKAGFVALVYWVPVLVLFGLAAVFAGVSSVPEPGTAVDALNTLTGLTVLAGGLTLLAVLYVLPAAVANMAYHDEFGAAFRLRELAGGSLTEDYATRWVFTVVYQAVVWPFILLLYVVLLGFFLRAHVGISVRSAWGRGLRDGLDLEAMSPPPAEQADDRAGSEEPAASDEPAGFVDLEELVDDPDRPQGVAGPAADEGGDWPEEFRPAESGDDDGEESR